MPALRFYYLFYLILRSYDYNMLAEGLLLANLCLATLLSLEQCLQFERFRLQYVQMVNKTSSFKTKKYYTETRRVNRSALWCLTFPLSRQQTSRYKLLIGKFLGEKLASLV